VLAIIALGNPDARPVIVGRDGDNDTDKQGERRIWDWHWVDSDHLIIEFSSRDNYAGQWFDNVRYASFNRKTGEAIPLGWDRALGPTRLLWWSDSGSPHALIERSTILRSGRGRSSHYGYDNPEVIDVDLDSGDYTIAMRPNPEVSHWIADDEGVVRMGSDRSRDSGKLTILYRPDGESAMRTIYDAVPDRYAGAALPSIFLTGSNEVYAYGTKDGYRAVYTYDLATMKLGEKVFGVSGYDVGGTIVMPHGKALAGFSITEGRAKHVWLDPRLKEIQEVLDQSFGAGNVYINSYDDARETILFRVAAPGQAQTWYVYHTRTGSLGLLGYDNDVLKNAMLNPVSVVRYPASDGKQIEAILTMPRHRAGEKNLPLIVLPHGGPWARDTADWDPYGWAQALAEYGYVVIQPNYRGSTGYGVAWEKASENAWGYRMQDDLNDAITWLTKQGTIDPTRVCMMGWSYGGYAASRAAERDGDKYRCAISGAGVHDLPAMIRYDKDYLGDYGAKMGMGSASNNLVDASPGLHPEKYSIPILIIQGARDTRVPPSQSRNLVEALKNAGKVEGKDFVYVEQPLNTHNLLREEDRIQVLEEVKKFLDKHNPA
jgi:dipeptidyl aminopeptidase/acylaminoacyl peptidase